MGKKIISFILIFCMILSCLTVSFAGIEDLPLVSDSGKLVADKDTRYIVKFEQDPNTKLITATTQIYNGGEDTLELGLVATQISFNDKVAPCKIDGTDLYVGGENIVSDNVEDYVSTELDIIMPLIMQNDENLRTIYMNSTYVRIGQYLKVGPGETKDANRCYFMPINNEELEDGMFYYKNFMQIRRYKITGIMGSGQHFLAGTKEVANVGDVVAENVDAFKMHFKTPAPTNLAADNIKRAIINYDETTMEWATKEAGPYQSGKPAVGDEATSIYVRVKEDEDYSKTTDVYVNYKKYLASDAVKIDFTKGENSSEVMQTEKTSKNLTAEAEKRTINKVGDKLQYTIKATNNGPTGLEWKDIKITDELPEGITFVEGTVKKDGVDTTYTYTPLTRILEIEAGTIGSKETVEITFEAEINKDAEGKTIKNIAKVAGKDTNEKEIEKETEEPGNGREVESPASVYAEKQSENLTSTDGKTRVGDTIKYTITAGNNGEEKSIWKAVKVEDEIPEGITINKNSVKLNDKTISANYNEATRMLEVEIGDIKGQQEAKITFEATVDTDAYGKTIKNTATVRGKDTEGKDITKEIEEPNNGREVENPADIYASKTSTNQTSKDGIDRVGDTLEYTITAGNNGAQGSIWKEVKITDGLPEGVTFVENSVKANGNPTNYTYSAITRTLEVEIGDINAKEEVKITFEVTIDEEALGKTIKNAATVNGTDKDGNEAKKEVEEPGKGREVKNPVGVYTEKISENKTSQDGKNRVGDTLEYTITARNNGQEGSIWKEVKVVDKMPEGVTYVKGSVKVNGKAVQENYDETTRVLEVTIGDIKAKEEAKITFEATIDEDAYGKTIKNTATISGKDTTGEEINKEIEEPGNGKEVESPTGAYARKISENKTSQDGKNRVGDKIEYKITVGNNGEASSIWKEVKVEDKLPEGVTLVENSVKINGVEKGYSYNERTIEIEIGNIEGQREVEVTFEVTINEEAEGKTIKNIATIKGIDKDGEEIEITAEEPNGGREIEKETKDPEGDMTAEKTSTNTTRTTGKNEVNDTIKYSIKITNTGINKIVLENVKVTDTLPEGVTFVNGSVEVDGEAINVDTGSRSVNTVRRSIRVVEEVEVTTGTSVTGSAITEIDEEKVIAPAPSVTTGSAMSYSYDADTRVLKVDLGEINSGEEKEITFEVKINSDAYGKTIVNTAKVEAEGSNGEKIEKEIKDGDGKKIESKDNGGNGGGGNSGGGNSGGGNNKPSTPDPKPELEKKDHFAYIMGYPEGDIRPLNQITREEVAVIFYRLLTDASRESMISTTNSFTDMQGHDWSNKAISTLSKAGILKGYEDGTFRPSKAITRAEFAAIASRFDKLEAVTESKFKDIQGHWAESVINSAEKKGWIKGYEDNTFRADNNITRAEAMTLINNVLGRKVLKENIHKDAKQWTDNKEGSWYYEIVIEATNSHDYTIDTNGNEDWTGIKANKVWP